MYDKLMKLGSLYSNHGVLAVAKSVGRSVISSMCDYQIVEVRGRVIFDEDPAPTDREKKSDEKTPCTLVESTEELEPFANEFCLRLRDSFAQLKRRIQQGCILILARRAKENGTGYEVAGYSIMEIGGFAAAGITGRIAKDILFVHYTEVANEYRGQRIAQVITRARNDYCREKGIKKSCTAHGPGNTSSERAFRKFGSRLLCYAVRVSLLRGLIVWHTPWRKIEAAIEQLDDGSKFDVRGSNARQVEVSEQVKVKVEVEV
jgi:hypothetical protein